MLKPMNFSEEPLNFKTEEQRKEFSALWRQGNDLYKENRFAEALECYLELDRKWPRCPHVTGWIAVFLRELNQLQLAIHYLRITTEVSPKSEFASIVLFMTLLDAGLVEEAFNEKNRFEQLNGGPSYEYEQYLKAMKGELSADEVARQNKEYDDMLRRTGRLKDDV